MENKEEYVSKEEAKRALLAEFAFHSYAGPEECAVIDRLPAADVEERRKWHKTSEELPENQGTYLVCTNRRKVITTPFSPLFQRFNGYAGRSCTHWMETPEPPEEAELGEAKDE